MLIVRLTGVTIYFSCVFPIGVHKNSEDICGGQFLKNIPETSNFKTTAISDVSLKFYFFTCLF